MKATFRAFAILAGFCLICSGNGLFAQDHSQNQKTQGHEPHNQFDDHDQQVTHDWYNQHQKNPPMGLRKQDRLPEQKEAELQRGKVLPRDLQRQEHPIPPDLSHKLPTPPHNSHYVTLGGHVAQVDNHQRVQDVIHLEVNLK